MKKPTLKEVQKAIDKIDAIYLKDLLIYLDERIINEGFNSYEILSEAEIENW